MATVDSDSRGFRLQAEELNGVYAVPPLPRKTDARRSLNLDAAECVARHIDAGGITRFLYGGNAFLYHASLDDFQALVEWLSGFPVLSPVARALRERDA